jgi:impB/mucB/samB family
MEVRKIVHIDMDAFYASVEQRDDPQLRGKPVVVAWKGNRSVVCAASYEARKFGVRSAMPAVRAERLCPEAIFVPPDFTRYRAVSQSTREIFKRHTDLIEPLSLDEAYLDVTENKTGLTTATRVARTIREQIREVIVPGHALRCGPETSVTSPFAVAMVRVEGEREYRYPVVEAVGMWESRRDFQRVWEGWEAGFMAFHAFHTLSFSWPAFRAANTG